MLKRQKILRLFNFSVIIFFLFIVSAAYAEPILIRFSHVVGESTPKGIGANMFRDLVEQRLPGKVRVEVFPNSLKFTDEQALLGLLFGDIEMAAPSFPKFRKFSKALQVFDLPFLFENTEEIHRFQQSEAGQGLLSAMEDIGIKGLQYWDNGMRVISTKKPLKTPADLKGLTLRIESSLIFQRQYSRLGAVAIPMPFKRLPDSIRDGIVDGYENAWSNVLSRQLHVLFPNFIEVNHNYLGYMVVTSKDFWNTLPNDIRSELKRILDEVTEEVNRLALEKAQADKNVVMQNSNVNVVIPNDEEKQLWKDAMLPVWKDYEKEIGKHIIDAAMASKTQK